MARQTAGESVTARRLACTGGKTSLGRRLLMAAAMAVAVLALPATASASPRVLELGTVRVPDVIAASAAAARPAQYHVRDGRGTGQRPGQARLPHESAVADEGCDRRRGQGAA